MKNSHTKHEMVYCESCQNTFECKANSSTYCQCTQVTLSLEEAEYISESFDNCLCATCLNRLKNEFHEQNIIHKN